MMPRGFGDHHASIRLGDWSSIGNRPRRYAATSVAGSRSAPTAMRSSSGHSEDGGKNHELSPTGRGGDCQSVTTATGTEPARSGRLRDEESGRRPICGGATAPAILSGAARPRSNRDTREHRSRAREHGRVQRRTRQEKCPALGGPCVRRWSDVNVRFPRCSPLPVVRRTAIFASIEGDPSCCASARSQPESARPLSSP